MNRNSFVKLMASTLALISTPFLSAAQKERRSRAKEGFLVKAGEARSGKGIELFDGDTFWSKISAQDTDSDLYVFESSRVKKGGPSHHFHYEQDEWWYVLEGEFRIRIGDKIYEAKKGDSVFGPRGIPHSFSKDNEGVGRLLMIFQPAGKMEEFFAKVSQGATKGLTAEQGQALRKEHGFESVGPGLGELKF